MTGAEILDIIRSVHTIAPRTRETLHDVAEVAVLRRADGQEQTVGFITSVSNPFCGNCSRLRLSAIGECFTCLFAETGVRSERESGMDRRGIGECDCSNVGGQVRSILGGARAPSSPPDPTSGNVLYRRITSELTIRIPPAMNTLCTTNTKRLLHLAHLTGFGS